MILSQILNLASRLLTVRIKGVILFKVSLYIKRKAMIF